MPQASYGTPSLNLTIFGAQVRSILSSSPAASLLWFVLMTAPQLIVTLTERLTTGIAGAYTCNIWISNHRNTWEMLIKYDHASTPGLGAEKLEKLTILPPSLFIVREDKWFYWLDMVIHVYRLFQEAV
jgi:hypothetical protein